MAALTKPRAGDQASTHNWGKARAEKPRLAGSIVAGILVGAAAACLVGGLIGVHESSASSILVTNSAVIQPAAP